MFKWRITHSRVGMSISSDCLVFGDTAATQIFCVSATVCCLKQFGQGTWNKFFLVLWTGTRSQGRIRQLESSHWAAERDLDLQVTCSGWKVPSREQAPIS